MGFEGVLSIEIDVPREKALAIGLSFACIDRLRRCPDEGKGGIGKVRWLIA